MSTTTSSLFNLAARQVTIYFGISLLITGIIGGIANIIVFLSLKTFRENSCALYLTIMSVVNIGHLLTGLFSRIMISGFNMDWTQSSIIYCKIRPYFLQLCVLLSFTCMCLATIDQFLATCSKIYWQQWSNIKVAHRLVLSFTILWLLHGIPYLIYFNVVESSTSTHRYECIITNENFQIYHIAIQTIGFQGLVPVIINSLFALLAYHNIRNIAYRTIPLVRRELDKQLTNIVLIQAIYHFLSTIPYLIINILILNGIIRKNSVDSDQFKFANILTLCIFYINFASPFYMYMCVSTRFRQQFLYVFCNIHFNRFRRRIRTVNQVVPQ